MQSVFIDGGMGRAELLGLLVVAAWGIAGAVLALRTFNWEPRGG